MRKELLIEGIPLLLLILSTTDFKAALADFLSVATPPDPSLLSFRLTYPGFDSRINWSGSFLT